MIDAVIFDMDGLMVDTEKWWWETHMTLAKNYGKVFSEEINRQMMGRKETEALQAFIDSLNILVEVNELREIRKNILLTHLDKITTNPGLFELLDLIDKLNLKKAIATSVFSDLATKVLTQIDVIDRFETIVTGDEVEKGKPNPEIFLNASMKLGVNSSNCIVLEDAQNGIEAAANAGMIPIAIPTLHSSRHDFSRAKLILNSLEQVTEQLLKQL